ncbi:MAG: hypothetical protein L6Q37_04890, partial [Bdellovibrionaceae bacterium]|nr:hypothetical protein [Pseudobdellovibrionaceae bacterium]
MGNFLSIFVVVLFTSVIFSGCKSNSSNSETTAISSTQIYFHQMKTLVVDVYYEPGAEPYEGKPTTNGNYYWNIFEDNLKALFSGRTVVISVPKELSSMNSISAQNKTTWSALDVVDLGNKFQKTSSDSSEIHFSIFFLKGNALGSDGQTNVNTIGFSV